MGQSIERGQADVFRLGFLQQAFKIGGFEQVHHAKSQRKVGARRHGQGTNALSCRLMAGLNEEAKQSRIACVILPAHEKLFGEFGRELEFLLHILGPLNRRELREEASHRLHRRGAGTIVQALVETLQHHLPIGKGQQLRTGA